MHQLISDIEKEELAYLEALNVLESRVGESSTKAVKSRYEREVRELVEELKRDQIRIIKVPVDKRVRTEDESDRRSGSSKHSKLKSSLSNSSPVRSNRRSVTNK